MKNEIKILTAEPEEAEYIIRVYYETWLDTYPNEELGITREDIEISYKDAFKPEEVKKLKVKIGNGDESVKRLVAKIGDKIVGVATAAKGKDNNELRTIYVLPQYQGQGVGKKLWEEAKKFFDPSKDIIVQVVAYNKDTIEFYKKIGFVDTGIRREDDILITKSGARMPEMEMVIKVD
jgi:ribosomal protein S18 acetylase RimI-like enzyme